MESPDDSNHLWELRLSQLQEWKQMHGDCAVPKAAGLLGRWTSRQREIAKKGRLGQERINALTALGFVWDANDSAWNAQYSRLVEYYNTYGHSCVPSIYPALGIWVAKQRGKARNGKLSSDRVEKLNSLNFVWSPADAEWHAKYEQLKNFHRTHGHCSVPFKGGDLERLGWWANTQRQSHRKKKLSTQRVELLNRLGFVWNPSSAFCRDRRRRPWEDEDDVLSVTTAPSMGTPCAQPSLKRFRSADGLVSDQSMPPEAVIGKQLASMLHFLPAATATSTVLPMPTSNEPVAVRQQYVQTCTAIPPLQSLVDTVARRANESYRASQTVCAAPSRQSSLSHQTAPPLPSVECVPLPAQRSSSGYSETYRY